MTLIKKSNAKESKQALYHCFHSAIQWIPFLKYFLWGEEIWQNKNKISYSRNEIKRVLLNRAPSSIHLYPARPSSIYLHPALCNTLIVIRAKISHVIGQFSQIQTRNFKVVHFEWKLTYSGVLILDPDINFWNCDPKFNFRANLGQKSKKCLFCLKIGKYGILRMLIFILTLLFWISNPKSIFRQPWVEKFKVVCFAQNFADKVSG